VSPLTLSGFLFSWEVHMTRNVGTKTRCSRAGQMTFSGYDTEALTSYYAFQPTTSHMAMAWNASRCSPHSCHAAIIVSSPGRSTHPASTASSKDGVLLGFAEVGQPVQLSHQLKALELLTKHLTLEQLKARLTALEETYALSRQNRQRWH
jgi:hypothetical protein